MMRWLTRSTSRFLKLEDGEEAATGGPERPPRYVGEDTRATTKKELLGWYTYAFGAEVFAVCGVGGFIFPFPLYLRRRRDLYQLTLTCRLFRSGHVGAARPRARSPVG